MLQSTWNAPCFHLVERGHFITLCTCLWQSLLGVLLCPVLSIFLGMWLLRMEIVLLGSIAARYSHVIKFWPMGCKWKWVGGAAWEKRPSEHGLCPSWSFPAAIVDGGIPAATLDQEQPWGWGIEGWQDKSRCLGSNARKLSWAWTACAVREGSHHFYLRRKSLQPNLILLSTTVWVKIVF